MAYENITLEITGGIATLTLNRPEALNAITIPMADEVIDALDRLRDEGPARVLILTGAGRAFCSGADLTALETAKDGAGADLGRILERHLNPLIERLFALPIPVVSVVNGPAVGAGCSIALAGDLVLAARSAYFLLAFVNIGLVPDMGVAWLLPRLAGRAKAQGMMMLGERVPAEQAEDWGLIYSVIEDGALLATANTLAEKLAKGPTRAYALMRQTLRACLEQGLTEALWTERLAQREAGRTEDFAEGLQAFFHKRPAVFKGR